MAFAGFDVLTINTADSEVCVSHEITDYMRSLIISSNCFNSFNCVFY